MLDCVSMFLRMFSRSVLSWGSTEAGILMGGVSLFFSFVSDIGRVIISRDNYSGELNVIFLVGVLFNIQFGGVKKLKKI